MLHVDAMPILLCYDGSDGSRRSIKSTACLFPGATIIVVHAWQPAAVVAAAYGGAVSLATYDDAALQESATEIAEEGSRIAAAHGLDARPEVAEVNAGGIGRAILDLAEQRGARLIVLGARGLSGFKAALLGSVSRDVLQHSRRAVMIVPPDTVRTTAGS